MSRPKLDCCEPRLVHYPSRMAWTHSRWCSVVSNRNMKVRQHDTTLAIDARLRHPAGSEFTAVNPVAVYRSHPQGCICEVCSSLEEQFAYIDAHLDDDDDRTLETA